MIKILVNWIFVQVSRALRNTPLRRIKWVIHLHDQIFVLLRKSSVVHLKGYTLYIDQRDRTIGKKLSLYGQYEDNFQELLLSLAIPGTIVIDVGANIGLHTIPLSRRVGSNGQVIAFEPDPDNYRLLVRNIEVNGLKNVIAYQKGLSSISGSALLYQSPENRGGLSLRPQNVETSSPQVDHVAVEILVADEILDNILRPISVVKIDVEGAEPLVLQGMRKILGRNPAINILFEFWPRFIRNFNVNPYEFLKRLEDDGFKLGVIDSTGAYGKTVEIEDIIARGDASEIPLNIHATRPMKLESVN